MTSEVKLEPTAEEIERVSYAILGFVMAKKPVTEIATAAILAMDRRASPDVEPSPDDLLDHEKIPTWPPLKKALWDVVTGETLNDGHYVNAYDLTDKLYSAVSASPPAPAVAEQGQIKSATSGKGLPNDPDNDPEKENIGPTGDDLRAVCEWLANHIGGMSLMDWNPCANVLLQAADRLDAISAAPAVAVELLRRARKLTKQTFPGGGTITGEIDAFLAGDPIATPKPFGWARGVHQPSTPNGPPEYDVDFVYGDDEPAGDGWFPVYREPAPAAAVPELLGKALAALDNYADPTGYTSSNGEQLDANDEVHEGLLAKSVAAEIRAALAAAPEPPATRSEGPDGWIARDHAGKEWLVYTREEADHNEKHGVIVMPYWLTPPPTNLQNMQRTPATRSEVEIRNEAIGAAAKAAGIPVREG